MGVYFSVTDFTVGTGHKVCHYCTVKVSVALLDGVLVSGGGVLHTCEGYRVN